MTPHFGFGSVHRNNTSTNQTKRDETLMLSMDELSDEVGEP